MAVRFLPQLPAVLASGLVGRVHRALHLPLRMSLHVLDLVDLVQPVSMARHVSDQILHRGCIVALGGFLVLIVGIILLVDSMLDVLYAHVALLLFLGGLLRRTALLHDFLLLLFPLYLLELLMVVTILGDDVDLGLEVRGLCHFLPVCCPALLVVVVVIVVCACCLRYHGMREVCEPVNVL